MITSIGGIVGKVVHVTENTIVIETSDDRVRIELTKWAVSSTGVQTSDQPETKRESKEEKSDKDDKKVEPAEIEEKAGDSDGEEK